jgi:rubrerythrin
LISDDELQVLSFYRASELAGSVLFGRLALQTTIDSLRAPLTRHCMEEARHAWMLTDLITRLGATPLRTEQTYQSEVGHIVGLPGSMLEILCLTRVLELAVVDQYRRHSALPGLNPAIQKVLKQMVRDEASHIDWIQLELEAHAKEHGSDKLDAALRKAESARREVFAKLLASETGRRYFAQLDGPGGAS